VLTLLTEPYPILFEPMGFGLSLVSRDPVETIHRGIRHQLSPRDKPLALAMGSLTVATRTSFNSF